MKIAVFMGGSSAEREISLLSGKAVAEGLSRNHEVHLFDVEWSGNATLFPVVDEVKRDAYDIVFLALHGGLGENGGIQGVLEAAGIVYTGSGITASALAMNKDLSKTLFVRHGIPTAPWLTGTPKNFDSGCIEAEIGLPCVIKPVDQGSTIGLSVVRKSGDIPLAIETAGGFGDTIMVEKYITGKELSVPILAGHALPVIEIRPSHEIYDYECKYTPGMTEYRVPAPIPEALASETGSLALRVFDILGLRDIARIDFRLDEHNRPLCFEANTLPGMTATSLVPKSAERAGIDFHELVSTIAHCAYQRKRNP